MVDKADELLLRKAGIGTDYNTTNDIIFRGHSATPIITDVANNKLGFWDRQINKLYTKFLNAKLVEDTKKSRQPVPRFTNNPEVQIRIPEFNYRELTILSKTHWLLKTIFRVIIGEILNSGWSVEARFKHRCSRCGREFDTPNKPDKCDICGGKRFDTPDVDQFKLISRIIKEPAPGSRRSFAELIRSTFNDDLALDDFYWEIGHKIDYDTTTMTFKRVPVGIRVLDGSITYPVQDVYGNFSSFEFFCPICYKETYFLTNQDTWFDIRTLPQNQQGKTPRCKRCNEPMVRTAYKQIHNGKTISRFAEDEVVQGSTDRVDPESFGMSKVAAAAKHLLIIDFMDEYNYQAYGQGHISKLLFMVGSDQEEIERILTTMNNQLNAKSRQDIQTNRSRVSLQGALTVIGQEEGKNVVPVDIMPDLTAMQAMDYYRLYVEKVSGVFGVTPTFVSNVETQAGGQNSRMEIDVQNRVTRRYMNDFLEPFNNQLLPLIGVTDWVLEFGNIESRDMLRDAQIKQTNIMAISLAISAGFDVEVSPDVSKYTISPQPVRPPESRSRSEAGKIPQDRDGAPTRTMPDGASTGTPLLEPESGDDE